MMQRLGFALPMALAVPCTVLVLSSMCARRRGDACYMTEAMTKELFWKCDDFGKDTSEFISSPQTWIWLCWLASQIWITVHLWRPRHERLARSEKYPLLCTKFFQTFHSILLQRRFRRSITGFESTTRR
jgi:chitin synthase